MYNSGAILGNINLYKLDFLPFFLFFLFFWVLFSGDSTLFAIQLFPFVIVFLFVACIQLNVRLVLPGLIIYLYFILLIFCLILSAFSGYHDVYFLWVFKSFIGFLSLYICYQYLFIKKDSVKFVEYLTATSIIVLLIFVVGLL